MITDDKLADYRSKTKEYLRLRGNEREKARKMLIDSRERMYHEKINNIQTQISELQNKLNSESNANLQAILRTEIQKLEIRRRKLQSRLDHDEW